MRNYFTLDFEYNQYPCRRSIAILTYLVTDIAYSPIEILQNFSPLFLIPSAVVSLVGIFNAVRAEIFSDKIWLIAGVIVYLAVSIIEISCLITVKEDAED